MSKYEALFIQAMKDDILALGEGIVLGVIKSKDITEDNRNELLIYFNKAKDELKREGKYV